MNIARQIRKALRGRKGVRAAGLEAWRRSLVVLQQSVGRARLAHSTADGHPMPHLRPEFARQRPIELLEYFRARSTPKFLAGFTIEPQALSALQREQFPVETTHLLERARRIVEAHAWPLLGYGGYNFGAEIDWLRDPLSGAHWPLDFHGRVAVVRNDGSDARVLWELNRLGHLITLGRAYVLTGDEKLSAEFFAQIENWRMQNPVGRGVNWACAMEVALRAINLLAAFQLFLCSPLFNEERLLMVLGMLDEHGTHIHSNLEFSYLGTSNHYLTDTVGLLWLGLICPELSRARAWRELGLREMLREMDKQVLADGADYESSTGYHRLVLELFLYSFILCRTNGIEIATKYWNKLRAMLEYTRAYLRPEGPASLVGDTDSSRVLPIAERTADDHAYVLEIGAVLFDEPCFKISRAAPEEVLWLMGEEALRMYRQLPTCARRTSSAAFPEAGVFIMREDDLYLLFNASGAGLGGRGSHGHNDALSIELSACGRLFIVDPGTYVYAADLHERHLFRSTAYHSTVEVDETEQNTTDEQAPFVIGDEARPRVVRWETSAERDLVIAEHGGYARLPESVTHRRTVLFDKRERYWLIEDTLSGAGEHLFRFFFHTAAGLEVRVRTGAELELCDKITGARLLVAALDMGEAVSLEPRWTSRDYGAKSESQAACWAVRAHAPLRVRWALVPVCAGEDENARYEIVAGLRERGSSFDSSLSGVHEYSSVEGR